MKRAGVKKRARRARRKEASERPRQELPPWLTVEQVSRLFAVIRKRSKRDYALFLLAYRHGLRASEVGALLRENVDAKANRIRFSRLKGSLPAEHLLQPDEARALRSYLRSRTDPLPYLFLSRNRNGITRTMLDVLTKRYGELAGLPKDRRHFHVLKHSLAVHLLTAGADLSFVQDWLGHKEIANTRRYAQIVNPERDRRALRLFPSREIAR